MLHQVLKCVRRYLNGYSTLKDLQTWLLSNLQRILQSGDEEAINLVNQIDADLIELNEGLVTEIEVYCRLERYVRLGETILRSLVEEQAYTATHATAAVETFNNHIRVTGMVEDLPLKYAFI